MHPILRRASLAAITALCCLSLIGCAAPSPPLSTEDEAALAQLAQIAGPTSGVRTETIKRTECWLPSDHVVADASATDTTWRVLCRVHWSDDTGDRHQDTTCIGDFASTPMLTECYRWTYYDQMPRFEDEEAVTAGS